MDVLVNPAILRQYAETVDATASTIRHSTLPDRMTQLSALLPGSRSAFMAIGGVTEVRWRATLLSGRYDAMSAAVRNAAGEYEATDDDLSAALILISPKW